MSKDKIMCFDNRESNSIDLTNTVDAKNQLGGKKYLRFGEVKGSPKILFAGNSMAWHAPKADIGWSGDWGMAASKRENDYVHQTMRLVREKYPNMRIALHNAHIGRRNMNNDNVFDEYSNLKDFDADAVVIVIGENIVENEHTQDELADKFSEIISYLRKGKSNVPVFISKPFLWEKPIVCKAIEKAAAESNAMIMDMSELSQDLSFRAIGKFEHSGVVAHPGDKGMKMIADIIYRNLEKVL